MSVVGHLTQFNLADLLQILAASDHSGKISLTELDHQGVIVLRRGKILYAASSSMRDTLGSVLVARGRISEEQLAQALDRKHRDDRERRLGNVLVEMGLLTEEELEDVVRWQVAGVLAEFLLWKDAYFRFEPLEIRDHGEVEVDVEDLVAERGFEPDQLLFGILRSSGSSQAETLAADMEAAVRRHEARVTSLDGILGGLPAPALTGELIGTVLDLGSRIAPRGALFTAHRRSFSPRASFGLADPSVLEALALLIDEPSVVGLVCRRREIYRGPLFASPANERLAATLGDAEPAEVLAIPLDVGRQVGAVFYAQAAAGETIGPSGGLELLLLRAGIEMEEAMLERRKALLEKAEAGSPAARAARG